MRYAALLRGVSPMNCKMPALKAALENAGFTHVKTVISSGNAVFSARAMSEEALQKKCEAAMRAHMGREFMTIVRPIDYLEALLARDPFARFDLPPKGKRNVTFFREPPATKPRLPIELRGARILAMDGREGLTCHVPNAYDPAFMVLIEKTFGKQVTTRTWETVGRIVKAAATVLAFALLPALPLVPAGIAHAQPPRDAAVARALATFTPGDRIRVVAIRTRWVGRLERVAGDTVFFGTPGEHQMGVRFSAVDSVWREGRATSRGAWIGALSGALLSGAATANRAGNMAVLAAYAVGGAIPGALIGGVVGSRSRRWLRLFP